MADRNFTPRPAIVRGSLVHQVRDVLFAEFKGAACAWSAADAERAEALETARQAKHEAQPIAAAPDPAHAVAADMIEITRPLAETGKRTDLVDTLTEQRTAALATMKANIHNAVAFSAACRQEAELAAQIRRHKRHRNGRALPLTADDQYIFQRASVRQKYDYRRVDSDDAEVARLRLTRGGIVANVKAGVRS